MMFFNKWKLEFGCVEKLSGICKKKIWNNYYFLGFSVVPCVLSFSAPSFLSK